MRGIRALFAAHVIGQYWHLRVKFAARCPIGLEVEFSVAGWKAVDEMRVFECWLAIEPVVAVQGCGVRIAGKLQRLVDDFPSGHPEAAVVGAEALRELTMHVVIFPCLGVWLDHFASDLKK